MFRDRTNLFISYRRTAPRNNNFSNNATTTLSTLSEEEQGLMGSRRIAPGTKRTSTGVDRTSNGTNEYHDSIEMKVLPPSFFDIASEIDDHLKSITGKIGQLNALYKKNLLPGFNDRTSDEEEIEQLNYSITKTFQSCYVLIKKFEFLQKNSRKLNYSDNEVMMIENLKKNYALRIQNLSSNFRKLQNNYIKFLKEDDFEENTAPLLKRTNVNTSSTTNSSVTELTVESGDIEDYSRQALQQSQLTAHSTNEQYILQREQEISKLAMGVLEVSSIFREMESMIIDQGTILDRIDYNLTSTVADLKEADKELIQGSKYQKRTQKCKIIFLLSLIVFALLIIVLMRPHSTTKVIEKPADKPAEKPDSRPSPEEGSGLRKRGQISDGSGDFFKHFVPYF
ncbi:t-SNARE affecting a late Golgi compartment protein 2 [[Candida] railenensis]|uniref:t-SNARE affecting a late Golgi compartment protein 2 n=1 Tax=[Candida] railenensis TaxID=45579 RepID=A0A9P0VVJ0_9ASCO|nr:t-SNARE affecting a late Golgi compartment protein 2 [[Candida] railenensis]